VLFFCGITNITNVLEGWRGGGKGDRRRREGYLAFS